MSLQNPAMFLSNDVSLGELQEQISKLEDEEITIDKRKKKIYNDWKNKMNSLMKMYNQKAACKIYKIIK